MKRTRSVITKREPLSRFLLVGFGWIMCVCIQISCAAPFTSVDSDTSSPKFSSYQLLQHSFDVAINEATFGGNNGEGMGPTSRSLLGRTTITGGHASNRFCSMDSDDNCDWTAYGEYLATIIIPTLVLAILCVILCPPFFLMRFCCGCFGGNTPSSGLCCTDSDDFEGYTKKQVWIVKGLVLFICLSVIIMCIVGFVGNAGVQKGIRGMGNTLIDTSNHILDQIKSVNDKMAQLNYTQNVTQDLDDVLQSGYDLVDQADKVKKTVFHYDNIRSSALIASLVLPMAIMFSGAAGALLNIKWLALIPALFCFFTSAVVWMSGGIHLTFSTVFDDLCKEIDSYLNPSSTNTSSNAVIDVLLSCKDGSAFTTINDLAVNASAEANAALCDALQEICQPPYSNCTYNDTECNSGDSDVILSYLNITVYDPDQGCADNGTVCGSVSGCSNIIACYHTRTLQDCATQCVDSTLRSDSETAVDNIILFANYTDLLLDDIIPLLNCSYIYDAVVDLEGYLCNDFAKGVGDISAANIVIAVLFIPGTVVLFMGFKRFRSEWADGGDYHDRPERGTEHEPTPEDEENRYLEMKKRDTNNPPPTYPEASYPEGSDQNNGVTSFSTPYPEPSAPPEVS